MNKAGGIIGIVAGVFGVIAAVVTILFGGLAMVFHVESAHAAVIIGWGGVFFSFMVIVFGAVAFAQPKGAGIGLIICSIAGALLGNIIGAICMGLALIGGILCLAGSNGAAQAQALAASADPSQVTPPPDRGPWDTGNMVLFSIASLLLPIIGVVVGTYSLARPNTKVQGAILLSLGIAGIVAYALLFPDFGSSLKSAQDPGAESALVPLAAAPAAPSTPDSEQFIEPDKQFLNSGIRRWVNATSDGYITVEQFVEGIKKFQMDNGKFPVVQGWTLNDNIYTLHLTMRQPLELGFRHILSAPENGTMSSLEHPVADGGEAYRAWQQFLDASDKLLRPAPEPIPAPTPAQEACYARKRIEWWETYQKKREDCVETAKKLEEDCQTKMGASAVDACVEAAKKQAASCQTSAAAERSADEEASKKIRMQCFQNAS